MSIFDILKYGNTDFRSHDEVSSLPIEILNKLWETMYPTESGELYTYEFRVAHIVRCTAALRLKTIEKIFKKILLEHNNEPV